MNTAQRRIREWSGPIGYALTFLALTIQVLLPVLVGLEITFADRLGIGTATICSAVLDGTPHGNNAPGSAHHDLQDGCPLCSALAAAQGVTAPETTAFCPPATVIGVAFHSMALDARATHHIAVYKSRAPPSLV